MEESELQRLQRLLQEADRLAEQAEQAERLLQELKRRAERAEEQTRPTTLDEYITACHDLVFTNFTVETKSLTSKGLMMNPKNRYCPSRLEPWSDFLEQQKVVLGAAYSTFSREERAFENRSFLRGLGMRIGLKRIANERGLGNFLHHGVEVPVKLIVDQFKKVDVFRDAFGVGDGIIFENHPSAISYLGEEVATPTTPTPPSQGQVNHNSLRPGQICVYKND